MSIRTHSLGAFLLHGSLIEKHTGNFSPFKLVYLMFD